MTLKQRLEAIKQLENTDDILMWPHRRFFSHIELFGSQISFGPDADYATLHEAQEAVGWLAEQLGGTVKWKTDNKRKKEVKK